MSHYEHNFLNKIRALGFRVTPQRQLILDAICQTGGHATIGQIYHYVNQKAPSLNRATIYRAVNFFAELQLVVRAEINGVTFYEIADPTPHHHLVCRQCGRVALLGDHHFQSMIEHLQQEHGFKAEINHLTISGLCPDCQGGVPAGTSPNPHS